MIQAFILKEQSQSLIINKEETKLSSNKSMKNKEVTQTLLKKANCVNNHKNNKQKDKVLFQANNIVLKENKALQQMEAQ